MLLLALDTATPAVTVALVDRQGTLAESTVVDARRHGELLAPGIAAVLVQAGVDRRNLTGIAVGVGPGPFTGLRVGVVTAVTLGAALGIPVHGVCSLDGLALAGGLDHRYVVATDARRREVFWASYSGRRRVDGPHVDRPAVVGTGQPVVGAGGRLYPDAFPDSRPPEFPPAAALAQHVLAGLPTLPPRPIYLRRPDTAEPHPPKPVLG